MIKKFYKALIFGFFKLLSLLPLKVLYLIAALLTPLLNHVFAYRKKIINENVRNAFPEWADEQINNTINAFYKHFAIMIMESVKLLSMSMSTLEKHIKLQNPEILQKYYDDGKSVIVISAHFGNWEWTVGVENEISHYGIAVYKPLNDKFFDKLIKNVRSKYRTKIVSMREIPKVLMKLKSEGTLCLSGYISDQSPIWQEVQYWTKFLNQDTAVYLGPEKLARKMSTAVVYFRMKVISRGKYEIEVVPITDDASKTKEFEITEKHVKLLEEDIKNNPEYWLWSHRRWKLTRRREEEEAQGRFRFEGQLKRKKVNA